MIKAVKNNITSHNTNLDTFDKLYFIGIGGIGMSGLALYFHAQGKEVAGYDRSPSDITRKLTEEGIAIHFSDDPALIPETFKQDKERSLIVYTPAIPKEHKEWNYFIQQGYEIKKRAALLGLITRNSYCMAVAGTHGKTTTSCILSHILKEAGQDISAFMGGIAKNYASNILIGTGDISVVEADEYDRSFLQLSPDLALITSMDPDHLDIYKDPKYMHESFEAFAGKLKTGGQLIVKKGLPLKGISYSASEAADYYASNIHIKEGTYTFDIHSPDEMVNAVQIHLPGRHNVENALGAAAMAHCKGISLGTIAKALGSFQGVKRRFEYHIKEAGRVYIDDYAHHPEEIKACIEAARELYPDQRITGVFQPHLYSRTRDFARGFAENLALLDELFLLDIYPAREAPIPGIHSQWLLEQVPLEHKELIDKEQLTDLLKEKKPEVLLTMGAGDIDRLTGPITKALES